MSRAPDLREPIPAPQEVIDAGLEGSLIFFVGAGVSRLIGLPSWPQLAEAVLGDLRQAELLNYAEIEQLRSLNDPKKLLSIATQLAEDNDYPIDYAPHLTTSSAPGSIYDSLNQIGCPCVTTNYDEFLSPQHTDPDDESRTPTSPKRLAGTEELFASSLSKPGTVVHLHGCVSRPETMIVTTKDYLEHYDNENVRAFLNELFDKKTVLFLGYGLEETEILEYILRRGGVKESKERRRFAVQGFFKGQQLLYEKLYQYYEKSFGVHLLGFVRDHEDYGGLKRTVESWAAEVHVRSPALADDADFIDGVL